MKMDYLSLLLPFGYLTILTLSLYTFSHLYRRRQALQSARLEPWFGEHLTRRIYLTLLEQSSAAKSGTGTEKAQKVPDSVLRAALLARSTTNIQRLVQLRAQKQPLTTLQQRGCIGDALVQRFNLAEKEMDAELRDCVTEANALAGPGTNGVQGQAWGQSLFQSAGEVVNQDNLRKAIANIESQRENERVQWMERRQKVRGDFLREVGVDDGENKDNRKEKESEGSEESAVVVEKSEEMERTASIGSSGGEGSIGSEGAVAGAKKKKRNKKKKGKN